MLRLIKLVGPDPTGLPAEMLLLAIFEHATDGFAFVDPLGTIRAWSPVAQRIYGLSRDEVVGCDQAILTPNGPLTSSSAAAADGEQRYTIYRRDEPTVARTVALRFHSVPEGGGTPIGTLVVVRDVSNDVRREIDTRERERTLGGALRALRASHRQLKSTQLQLIQSAKLESMGRIAAGVAHEVKNPLAILLTGTQMLRRRWSGADTVVSETLDDLEHAVKRANRIILGLLDFAASTELELEPADLEEILTAAVHLVQHELTATRVNLQHERGPRLPKLRLDCRKIEQVLVNLLMNAIQEMPTGGSLTIRTSVRQLASPGHGVGFRQTDLLRVGQTVAAIELEDSGPGIPDAILGKIFEPFFTTKAPGKGTGLGLAVCRTIVNLHGGSIWLENRAEGGARATLVLPAGEGNTEDS